MLTGKSPFEGKSFQEILNKNKKCQIDFSHKSLKKVSNSAFQLLKRMLEIDPTKRPSALDCLSSDFFLENDVHAVNPQPEGELSENLKNFQERYKFNVKSIKNKKTSDPQGEGMSMEFRAPAINGLTNTVNDSMDFNSKGNINSLNHMNAKKNPNNPPKEIKRESIYKAALMQHATILQQENYDTEDNSDSDEDSKSPKDRKKSSNSPGLNPNKEDEKRKSKFGG